MFDLPIMALVTICALFSWWKYGKQYRAYKRFCKANGHYCPNCVYGADVWEKCGTVYLGVQCFHPYVTGEEE